MSFETDFPELKDKIAMGVTFINSENVLGEWDAVLVEDIEKYCLSKQKAVLKENAAKAIEEFAEWVCRKKNETGNTSCLDVYWEIEKKKKELLLRLSLTSPSSEEVDNK